LTRKPRIRRRSCQADQPLIEARLVVENLHPRGERISNVGIPVEAVGEGLQQPHRIEDVTFERGALRLERRR
jgi:hypothetical protein